MANRDRAADLKQRAPARVAIVVALWTGAAFAIAPAVAISTGCSKESTDTKVAGTKVANTGPKPGATMPSMGGAGGGGMAGGGMAGGGMAGGGMAGGG
ncbi:MAG: hypothetical protein WD847_15955, partial [Pirellulales bacterium]